MQAEIPERSKEEANMSLIRRSPASAFKFIITLAACFGWDAPARADIGVGVKPEQGAEVLFDGSREMLDAKWTYWEGPRFGSSLPIKWKIAADPVDPGTVLVSDDPAAAGGKYGAADLVTKKTFRDFRLHIEFLVPKPGGNSGVYLQNRYEIQVLDGDRTPHGMGALINETPSPYFAYNGAGKWNAFDITFRAARFADGKRTEPARVTMYFNGRLAHVHQPIDRVWGGAASGIDGGNDGGAGITDAPGGLKLQAEGHEVLYRNIWIRDLDLAGDDTRFERPSHPAVIPVPRDARWMVRHDRFNERVKKGDVDLVFIGDSITQGWEGAGKDVWSRFYGKRKAVNLGIGGDQTQHVLWRLDHGNVDRISPKAAVVMIGTNNSGGDRSAPAQIVDGVTAIVETLRAKLPGTRILLLGIFPRGERFNDQRGRILQVNQAIRKLDDGDYVRYLDIGHLFIEKDGSLTKEIMPDFLHLSPKGYEIWATSIEDLLAEMMGERKKF
jgi:lysophospholipase L1-like esterase